MMNREAHLVWCKQRAIEYWQAGELADAVASMGRDLAKHPDTARSINNAITGLGMHAVLSRNSAGVRRWIDGFR